MKHQKLIRGDGRFGDPKASEKMPAYRRGVTGVRDRAVPP